VCWEAALFLGRVRLGALSLCCLSRGFGGVVGSLPLVAPRLASRAPPSVCVRWAFVVWAVRSVRRVLPWLVGWVRVGVVCSLLAAFLFLLSGVGASCCSFRWCVWLLKGGEE